jgi:hypothetical protein
MRTLRTRSILRLQRQTDVEPIGRQETVGTIRPFHEGDGALRGIIEAELRQLS